MLTRLRLASERVFAEEWDGIEEEPFVFGGAGEVLCTFCFFSRHFRAFFACHR